MSRADRPGGDGAPVGVIVANDHFAIRAGLRPLLDRMSEVQVLHEATEGLIDRGRPIT
jgi:DNA-binding NarL/FixJ family response regulator